MNKGSISILNSRHNRQLLLKRKTEVLVAFGFWAALIIIALLLNSRFMTLRNQRNLIVTNIGLLIVSLAQMNIIILGGVDLSVGSVISVVNVICVTLMNEASPVTWAVAVALSLAAGAGIGLLNGLIVAKGNLQPIIATLATQTFFAGVALLILPKPTGTLPSDFCKCLSKGLNYLVPMIIFLVVVVVMWLLLNRSHLGRNMLAVGANETSAKAFGINVSKVKIQAFVLSGFVAALAGIMISAFSTSGNPLIGEAYTQRSITVAAVGGASLAGGRGSVLGCVAATFILGIVNNILNLMGVSSYYQYVFQGLILIVALSINAFRTRR